MRDVKHNFGVTIDYWKTWKSRELALMSIRGFAEESYYILPTYCYELECVNSDTETHIHTNENNHFIYLFIFFINLWLLANVLEGFRSSSPMHSMVIAIYILLLLGLEIWRRMYHDIGFSVNFMKSLVSAPIL